MLETVKQFIKELPEYSFGEFYQKYIFDIQDDNLFAETQISDSTFNSLDKLLNKIRKEMET